MRFNPSNIANGVIKGVSFAASLGIAAAIALTAAVHIKHCIHDLLPRKRHSSKLEIHVYEAEEKMEPKTPETPQETQEDVHHKEEDKS